MNEEIPYYLFVYGTLRKEMNSPIKAHIINEVEWLGEAEARGQLYDIGHYPGAIPSGQEEPGTIKGEILELKNPEIILKKLDQYEGIDPEKPNDCEYRRAQHIINLPGGKKVNAWIYWYNLPVEGKKRIQPQDYLHYLKEKKSAQHGG